MPKHISAQIISLEQKLAKLKAEQIETLQEKLKHARRLCTDLETQIAAITGNASSAGKRKRTSSDEMFSRIEGILKKSSKGLTQKEIADQTGFAYGSVAAFLKNHSRDFKTTGQRKQKRYFSK